MKQCTLWLLAILFSALYACQPTVNSSHTTSASTQSPDLGIALAADAVVSHEQLQLYPVVAAPDAQQRLPRLKDVATAMQMPGFRITERKQFGDGSRPWYNGLTVQNKTTDTIYLMSGDVVTGGNQDRVIAYDDIMFPHTLKNVEVFCVEQGRSSYYNEQASDAERQVAAFKGYFSVASPRVRRAVQGGEQQKVWASVAELTVANDAQSATQTYAALAQENDKQAKRREYTESLRHAWAQRDDVVGVVAVCAGRVLAVDIFGNAALFRQRYPNLLQGYTAEVMMETPAPNGAERSPQAAFAQVSALADLAKKPNAAVGRFALGEQWVHLYQK